MKSSCRPRWVVGSGAGGQSTPGLRATMERVIVKLDLSFGFEGKVGFEGGTVLQGSLHFSDSP